MAIDEQDTFAGVADDADLDGDAVGAAARTPAAGADSEELRRRLETPLFAREPGTLPSAQIPGIRELTWDHVTNPTSSVPVVPGESIFGEHDGSPRPAPLKLEDVLVRREVGLKPLDEATADGAPHPDTGSSPTIATAAPTAGTAATLAPPVTPASTPAVSATPVAPLEPLPTPAIGDQATGSTPTRAALPSFADIVASAAAPAPAGGSAEADVFPRSESGGVDSLLKPIDEPPPVARETDPLVDGLAELILRSTPSVGMPRVAELREVSRGDTGMVPTVGGRGFDPPVLDAAVELANVSTTVPVVDGPDPEFASGAVDVVEAGAEVEAEMNRLAFLPDQVDDAAGPVEVPVIAYSDIRAADVAPAAPSLSTGEIYTARTSAAPVRHTYSDILASTAVPVVRKRKRHVVRNIFSLVLLVGVIAGGMFAVKHFVLDRVQWTAELEPLAKQVEEARGLAFTESVTVTVLPTDEYAQRLVAAAGYSVIDATTDDAMLRTLGLASGKVDRVAIGRAAVPDAPAFYDPVDGAVYEVEGLPTELRTFALHRALTMALLDQRFDWASRVAGQPDVNLVGTMALYDADALAVANAIVGDDADLRATLAKQNFELVASTAAGATPSRFVSVVAGRIGLAAWPYLAELSADERDLLEANALLTDAKVLDLRRLLDGTAEPSSDPASKGMLFWYHALASRLPANLAWTTSLAWRSDATTTTEDGGKVCTSATVTFDAAAVSSVEAAFTAWSLAAPPESTTAVRVGKPSGGLVDVAVTGCDPGADVVTNTDPVALSLGGAPLRIAQVADAMSATDGTNAAADEQALACAAYGPDEVTKDDERAVVDMELPWARIAAHPAVDPTVPRCKG